MPPATLPHQPSSPAASEQVGIRSDSAAADGRKTNPLTCGLRLVLPDGPADIGWAVHWKAFASLNEAHPKIGRNNRYKKFNYSLSAVDNIF